MSLSTDDGDFSGVGRTTMDGMNMNPRNRVPRLTDDRGTLIVIGCMAAAAVIWVVWVRDWLQGLTESLS